MARKLPPLLAIRAFEAAARLRSFTRAAHELSMTQSGVSYQIRQLEDLVQAPLFAKAGRGVELTPLGHRLAPTLTTAFDSIARTFADVQNDDTQVLTIACTQVFGANWLAPRIGRFQLANPGLAVRVNASSSIADLEGGEADVAIRYAERPWPGLNSEFLVRSPIIPMAQPEFLSRYDAAKTPEDILELPRTTADDVWWMTWFEQITGQRLDAAGRSKLQFDDQLLDGNAAISGHGVAMLNPFMWQSQIDQQLLTPLSSPFAMAKGSVWYCYLPRRRDERKIRAFRKWLGGEIADTIAWAVKSLDLSEEDLKASPLGRDQPTER